MSSGSHGSRRIRFDIPESPVSTGPSFQVAPEFPVFEHRDDRLEGAIDRTRDWLLRAQQPDGHWVGELEGDTILESEYILLLAYLGRENTESARLAANYLVQQQLPDGGWGNYPGGPLEVSTSVKAYFALKLTGHSVDSEYMMRARLAILRAGGAEKVNSFTRFYLALLGVISYKQCPAVPPELMLIPRWMPFNIYEMSAWSRTIVVPLSILWAYKPSRQLPEQFNIDELFLNRPEDLPVTMAKSEALDDLTRKTWLDWDRLFRQLDRAIKFLDALHIRPGRKAAVKRAAEWMTERFENSDGLGAIFPPIIWSVVALKCLGYADDSPQVKAAMAELDALFIREGDTLRLQPCKSPVWDTAIALIALREAGMLPDQTPIRKGVRWLLSKEIRRKGDWSVLNRDAEPGGWCFEYNNDFYPDVDDTSMVLMALCRCLPPLGDQLWSAEFLLGKWSPAPADKDAAAIVTARASSTQSAFQDLEGVAPQLKAIWRGARWVLAMQSKDGGWGAFDANNNRELFTRVPFADHNAMIDPSTVDLTSRMLEMFSDLNLPRTHPAVSRALDFVWKHQEPDGAWYGRWGVNYIYGTWQTLVGLAGIGVPANDPRIRKAVRWLESCQQPCGGWGETPRSYDEPHLRGTGPVTASQTAWALMGLLAAGEVNSEAVSRGVQYLLDTQRPEGDWEEEHFTGTGFPRVFYLKYHLYRVYFPLLALGRYYRLKKREAAKVES